MLTTQHPPSKTDNQDAGQTQFTWKEFEVETFLPKNWDKQIVSFALKHAVLRTLRPTSVTSRELSVNRKIPVLTVGGELIKTGLAWLYDLYRGTFRDLGQTCVTEPLSIAKDLRYAVNLNVQRGREMRYECHVDSNPLEGLLFVTDHRLGRGGELVVCNRSNAVGVREIKRDCKKIPPTKGRLLFFDAREHPHFVSSLKDPSEVRVIVAMNYYVPSCPESARPKDLNKHLFGED
jgi:hypothetical protein